jgi:hypothetical protein
VGKAQGHGLEHILFAEEWVLVKAGSCGCVYEQVSSSLCIQACFQAFSGFANSLTGRGKLKSAQTLKSYEIIKNRHDLIFRIREVK